jgi:hypothetical protein
MPNLWPQIFTCSCFQVAVRLDFENDGFALEALTLDC